jgi:excisionase family DNA binding protein
MVMSSNRPLLSASVSGSSAWIIAMLLRESLPARIGQLERDPHVPGDVVRDLRATAAGIQEAARQYRELVESSRSEVADSAEVDSGDVGAGLGNPSQRWVDTSEVAASLNCSKRWVTQLIQQGRLVAAKRGRSWRIDVDSVEDYRRRGAVAA